MFKDDMQVHLFQEQMKVASEDFCYCFSVQENRQYYCSVCKLEWPQEGLMEGIHLYKENDPKGNY